MNCTEHVIQSVRSSIGWCFCGICLFSPQRVTVIFPFSTFLPPPPPPPPPPPLAFLLEGNLSHPSSTVASPPQDGWRWGALHITFLWLDGFNTPMVAFQLVLVYVFVYRENQEKGGDTGKKTQSTSAESIFCNTKANDTYQH